MSCVVPNTSRHDVMVSPAFVFGLCALGHRVSMVRKQPYCECSGCPVCKVTRPEAAADLPDRSCWGQKGRGFDPHCPHCGKRLQDLARAEEDEAEAQAEREAVAALERPWTGAHLAGAGSHDSWSNAGRLARVVSAARGLSGECRISFRHRYC